MGNGKVYKHCVEINGSHSHPCMGHSNEVLAREALIDAEGDIQNRLTIVESREALAVDSRFIKVNGQYVLASID